MILFGTAVLVTLTYGYEAKSLRKSNTGAIENVTPGTDRLNPAVLAKLIHKINKDDEDNSLLSNQSDDKDNIINMEHSGMRNSKNAINPAPDMMELLQKNYEANRALNTASNGINPRIHYIKNPHILEHYKEHFLRKHYSTSSESADSGSSDYNLRLERLLRRNAVFRLGRDDQKPALRNGEARHKTNSGEHDKIIHFEPNDYGEKKTIAFKGSRESHNKINQNNIKNKGYDADTKNDAWEIITKNYDDWDKKDKKKEYDNYKKNSKYNKDNNKGDQYMDDDKKEKKYKHKDSSKKSEKDYNNYNSDDKKIGRHNDNNDNYKDYNKNDKFNDDYKPNDRYNDQQEDYNNKDRHSDNFKSSDRYKNDHQIKDNYKDDYMKSNKNNDNYKSNDKFNDYGDKRDERENKNRKRDDIIDKVDWDKPKNIKSKDKNWDSWKSKEKSDDILKKKHKSNWDVPKKENDNRGSYEKQSKNNWGIDGVKESSRIKTTKDWYKEEENRKPFVPQIPDYYHSRPRIRDNVAAFKAFGRTSIPFVGKKGIYEEK